jgi:Flp pilus assembly protein TadD
MEVRLSNAVVSYVVYLWQTAWPFDLAAYYPHPENTLTFAQILGACGLMLTVTVCAVRLRRTRPALLVGWLWYLGMLVPVIGVVQVGSQGHADRYTYLPQVGLWVAVVWGVPWRSMLGLRPLAGLAILLLALWSVQSARQVEHWRDSETLFTHSLACTGPNSVALSALGSAIAAQGRWKESVKLLREAVALPGADDQAHFMLGLSLGHLGREGEAATHFRIAYEMNPNRADAKANLIVAHANEGTLLAQKGELREALRHLNAALALDPEYVPARKNKALVCLNLGLGFGRSGKPREAVGAFREAVRSDPDLALAHLNLGVALLEVGDFTAAANAFRAVLRLVPNDPRARAGLAESLGKISP